MGGDRPAVAAQLGLDSDRVPGSHLLSIILDVRRLPTVKALYRPFGLILSLLAARLGGSLFRKLWQLAAKQDDPPKAMEAEYGWTSLLIASALQGAIFGVVKAAVDRGGAKAFERATGAWPGD